MLFVPALFYANAMQWALLSELSGGKHDWLAHIDLDERNAGWLLAAPGMEALTTVSNDLRDNLNRQDIGRRFTSNHEFSEWLVRQYQPYENMERGIIPDDAIMPTRPLGVKFYYLSELTAIDMHGLADYTIARNPVNQPNSGRRLGHDRRPPPGYLKERGANIIVHGAADRAERALAQAQYAVQVGPNLWMPFDSPDGPWAFSRFSWHTLFHNGSFLKTDPTIPSNNQVILPDGRLVIGERFIGDFEGGMDGWRVEGDAVTNHADFELYQGQGDVIGNIGPGFLTSYHPTDGHISTGGANSPKFVAESDQHLAFLIAGGGGDGVGARLLVDGAEVAVWRGRKTEYFRTVVYPLADFAGKTLQLQLFDDRTDETVRLEHIMLDHVLILR